MRLKRRWDGLGVTPGDPAWGNWGSHYTSIGMVRIHRMRKKTKRGAHRRGIEENMVAWVRMHLRECVCVCV